LLVDDERDVIASPAAGDAGSHRGGQSKSMAQSVNLGIAGGASWVDVLKTPAFILRKMASSWN
jgi:hypothetical protein